MKRAFTLLEMVTTLVVTALLSIGTFKALEGLYLHAAKAKALTELSLQSQIVLDELSVLLSNRISSSVIGYMRDSSDSSCVALAEANESYLILEWLGTDESNLSLGGYDGLIDLRESNATHLDAKELNASMMGDGSTLNLVFAGSIDQGDALIGACRGAFGWHGNDSNLSYDIKIENDDNLTITDSKTPDYLYEKYDLTLGAFAVARGVDINQSAPCIDDNLSALDPKDLNRTLLLFYDYRPWKGESFCADRYASENEVNATGSVSVLVQDVSAFDAKIVNDTLRLRLDLQRKIRGGSQSAGVVHITKQKAIF